MSDRACIVRGMTHMPLLWTDAETTGLDPHSDTLLEYAMALTDGDFRVVDTFRVVVGVPGVRTIAMAPNVRQMHEENGLLDEVEQSRVGLRDAERMGLDWAEAHGLRPDHLRDDTGPYMAGSSPQFDRGFYAVHMPLLARVWHYRNVDMTTLRYFFGAQKPVAAHRALRDVLDNVADLRRYVDRARACGLLALPGLAATA